MTTIGPRAEGGSPPNATPRTIKVWDPIVRIFHWTIVVACTLNLFILEEGKYWHRVTGYVVAAAVITRLIWGFVGTKHARFRDFLPTPAKIKKQIRGIMTRDERQYIGHNPLASIMMLAPRSSRAGDTGKIWSGPW